MCDKTSVMIAMALEKREFCCIIASHDPRLYSHPIMWDLKSDQGLLTDRYRFHLLVFGKLVDSRILFCSLGFTWSFRMLHWLPLQHNIGIQERTNSGKCGVLCFDLTSLWCIATKYRMFCEKQATRSNGVVQFRCDSYWHRITSHAIASCWEREVHEGIQSIYYIFTQRYWSTFGKMDLQLIRFISILTKLTLTWRCRG